MAVTVATVATIACSSSSQNAVVNAKPTSVQQKAAFLETFDDGISAWIKSEVEQYTGTIDRSIDRSRVFAPFRFLSSIDERIDERIDESIDV